jgi:hypothetical protein
MARHSGPRQQLTAILVPEFQPLFAFLGYHCAGVSPETVPSGLKGKASTTKERKARVGDLLILKLNLG